jgi:hypothetical protein
MLPLLLLIRWGKNPNKISLEKKEPKSEIEYVKA